MVLRLQLKPMMTMLPLQLIVFVILSENYNSYHRCSDDDDEDVKAKDNYEEDNFKRVFRFSDLVDNSFLAARSLFFVPLFGLAYMF